MTMSTILASAAERNMPTFEQSMQAYGETVTNGVIEALAKEYGFDAQEARDKLGHPALGLMSEQTGGPGRGNAPRKREKPPPRAARAVRDTARDSPRDTSLDRPARGGAANGDAGHEVATYGAGIVTTEGKGAIVLQTLKELEPTLPGNRSREDSHDSVAENAAYVSTKAVKR